MLKTVEKGRVSRTKHNRKRKNKDKTKNKVRL